MTAIVGTWTIATDGRVQLRSPDDQTHAFHLTERKVLVADTNIAIPM